MYLDGVDLGGRLSLCVHRFLRLRPSAGGPTCGKGRDAWARSEKYWFCDCPIPQEIKIYLDFYLNMKLKINERVVLKNTGFYKMVLGR